MSSKIYELSCSQEVNILQCKFTIYKQVMNILTSLDFEEDVDQDLLEKAWNKVIERNDCLRIMFFKKKGVHYQYFRDTVDYLHIPRLETTEEEFNNWYLKYRKSCIKYLKGIVAEPTIITINGKTRLFIKFCHLAVDVYGISKIFEDLSGVYNSLKNNTEMPKQLGSFEEIIAQDVADKNDVVKTKKGEDFFRNYLRNKPEPYFAVAGGTKDKLWAKRTAKGSRYLIMDLFKNDTKPYAYSIDKKTMDKVFKFSSENKITPATLLFYCYSLAYSKLNNGVSYMFPLYLSNCRGTLKQKNCAGTKVQSMAFYTQIDYKKSFLDDLSSYNDLMQDLLRHIGVSDIKMNKWYHDEWGGSLLSNYYSICYSFIPFIDIPGIKFNMYSNGKGALITYLVQLYNATTGETLVCYDVNVDHVKEEHVEDMHKKYVKLLNAVLDKPKTLIKDIKL